MMDKQEQAQTPFVSSKFVADWAVRQSKQNRGTWYGMTTTMIPTYAQLIP